MAPRKRKSDAGEEAGMKPSGNTSTRVTRSAARVANSGKSSAPLPQPELPKKKKRMGKVAAKKDEVNSEENTETEIHAKTEAEKGDEKVEAAEETGGDGFRNTVVIEHCKQCNSFKRRAFEVKDGLESRIPGITVLLNPDKPRRGCFEVREQGGETFISLLDMKRPFAPMKALDMDKVISDITDKIK